MTILKIIRISKEIERKSKEMSDSKKDVLDQAAKINQEIRTLLAKIMMIVHV